MAGKKDKIKDKDRFSIITQNLDKCYICGSSPTHIHEVFGGPYRAKSKAFGCCIGLCPCHHNMSNAGIHFNKDLDLKIKIQAEKIWIEHYTDPNMVYEDRITEFIKEFGKNYI